VTDVEIELNPVDYITVGTVGPKGRRLFHLQAGRATQVVSLTIEKEQARALGEAIVDMLQDLKERDPVRFGNEKVDMNRMNMDLREPIEPEFRVSQMGLGYDEANDLIILVARELVILEENQDPEEVQAGVARFWATREQMLALAQHAAEVVKAGRVDPQSNGRLLYYWT
jgi:uncharacterized repeat protein (TIGR03847 family)